MRSVFLVVAVTLFVLWYRPTTADACGVKTSIRAPTAKRFLVARRTSPVPRRTLVARRPIRVGPAARDSRKLVASGGNEAKGSPAASGSGDASVSADVSGNGASAGGDASASADSDGADEKTETRVATAEPVRDDREEPAARGRSHRLGKRIFFANGSTTLLPRFKTRLDRNARWLVKHGDKEVTIEGHTNTVGPAALNKALSEKRAEAVKEYLVSKGVDESRIATEGYGLEKPEFSPGNNPRNRRVVIIIE